MFAAYVPDRGHAFIDRRLDLPKGWTDQPDRRRAAHVPDGVRFATKPRRAVGRIELALKAGVPFAPRLPRAAASAKTDRPKADG